MADKDTEDDLHLYVETGPTEFLSSDDIAQNYKVIKILGREFRHMSRRVNDLSRRQPILEEKLERLDRLERLVFRGNGEPSLRERLVRMEADQERDRENRQVMRDDLREIRKSVTKSTKEKIKEATVPVGLVAVIIVEILKYLDVIPGN